jgi:hypothetical protein
MMLSTRPVFVSTVSLHAPTCATSRGLLLGTDGKEAASLPTDAQRSGSAAGRAAGRPLQPIVRPQSGLASDHISAAMTFLRVAKLGRNIGQTDHSLVDPVTSYKAERRPGSREIWLAVTKDDGMQVDSIFIDQAKFG